VRECFSRAIRRHGSESIWGAGARRRGIGRSFWSRRGWSGTGACGNASKTRLLSKFRFEAFCSFKCAFDLRIIVLFLQNYRVC
jgi:hypothetical protein